MRENPWEWEEDDLLALIANQATEGTELEFKACDALGKTDSKRTELSRDVSAMANAAGGAIVYGVIEDKKAKVAQALDLGYDPADISADWIHQVINSKVKPPLHAVKVNMIQLAKSSPGKVAYVVWIPQGSTAHQAADNKYYRRRGTERLAMEHYEIVDVMQRVGAPRLRIEIDVDGHLTGEVGLEAVGDGLLRSTPNFNAFVVNDDNAEVAEYSQHHVFVANNVVGPPFYQKSRTRVLLQGGYLDYVSTRHRMGLDDGPVFPGERRELSELWVNIETAWTERTELVMPWILWRSRAARAEPSLGAILFQPVLGGGLRYWPADLDEVRRLGFTVNIAP